MRFRRLTEIWREDNEGRAVVLRDSTHAHGLFVLNHTGAILWKAMDGTRSTDELVARVMDDSENPPAREVVEAHVRQCVQLLLDRGLIEVVEDADDG